MGGSKTNTGSGRAEPMPRDQFLKLMSEFEKNGGIYMADERSEAFLNIRGAEASTYNATTILFRRNPTWAAVYEELFHADQFRKGRVDSTVKNTYECEIEAKQYLLKNATKLQLTDIEI